MYPGLFNTRLHRVTAANRAVFKADGRSFAAADCGVPCVPARSQPGRERCLACFPWPTDSAP